MPAPAAAGAPGPARVAVLGEALVDAYPDGTQVPGGAPFNVARWLAAFEVPALLVTRLGSADAAAALLRAEMARFGLTQSGVQADARHATGCVRVLPAADPEEGHHFDIEADSAWDHIDAVAALQAVQAQAPSLVCYGSLALRHADTRAAITQCLLATPALRVLDLNLRAGSGLRTMAEHALHLADWVKVNEAEVAQLQQWFGAPTLPQLARHFAVQRWFVTRGAQGWYTFNGEGKVDDEGQAVPLSHLQDTVGAGDAFTAAVLAGQARGWPLARSLQAANRLAAAACTWRGALPADDSTVHHWRQTLGFGPPAASPTPDTESRTPC